MCVILPEEMSDDELVAEYAKRAGYWRTSIERNDPYGASYQSQWMDDIRTECIARGIQERLGKGES